MAPPSEGHRLTPSLSPLKQMVLVDQAPLISPGHKTPDYDETRLQKKDDSLKRIIRRLKFVSRALSTLLSLATLILLAITLQSFLSTRSIRRPVPHTGIPRGPWSRDSKVWPTYLYLGVAIASLLLHVGIFIAYLRSVRAANRAATLATGFTWAVTLMNLVIWVVGAATYRTAKDDGGGAGSDLWGWSCSAVADEIQGVFGEVRFQSLCQVQGYSWYLGIVQVVAAVLSATILYLAVSRTRTKNERWRTGGTT
ncbi:hypothetical protein P152DRAFT_462647 [Eremomyces bilateralis CBS 781.70]|uniref:MARVEL domain-containing protein n=1 Tax=Eremomyces bilateralis CBS 781.70 TaxID=1392243 RepID=A0A6G1FRS5_9PEZI|nr:uncharacterized protein P152DRAFT_462647 [Eremomyces bilateralis CBS 781.70]KAF1808372.1 hypothetical protein P152DRAFT_462647 [Eremomyces bilateralis CBS 781.70]